MLLLNTQPEHDTPLSDVDRAALDPDAARAAAGFLAWRGNHQPTPLHELPAMARELGVGAIHLKDEASRFGLGSFKALGGSYAVIRLFLEEASRRLGRSIGLGDLNGADVRDVARSTTFCAATDGNHGRSVAYGAQLIGATAVIFMHAGVSQARAAAIARLGAEIVRVDGAYDDSVVEAARVAVEHGWIVVSDTSWQGYERVPRMVMQGYTVLVAEALDAMVEHPTHVFVQAGVGGLAAAAAGHMALRFGPRRPTFVVVEPDRAACVFASMAAGRPCKIEPQQATVMAMLECYEPSLIAWPILARTADAFMTIGEDAAAAIMNRLARPIGDDAPIVAGESGGVGLAGLVDLAADPSSRAAIGLDDSSRVLVINTEGATDPARFQELVGIRPADVTATRPPDIHH